MNVGPKVRWYINQMISNTGKDKDLFVRVGGKLNFLKKCMVWPIDVMLHRLTKKHVSQQRRQLTVFAFDRIAHSINLYGVYEKDELETFFEWTAAIGIDFSDSTVLDVGANVGNHSLYFSDYFSSVISFEPNPRTFKVLSLNAELSDKISCHNIGLSNTTRSATLFVDPNNIGAAQIGDSLAVQCHAINLAPLDNYCTLKNVKLIKFDVEGHEYQAIEGARRTIEECRPIILFEQNISDFREREAAVVLLLKSMGYDRFAEVSKYPVVESSNMILRLLVVPIMRFLTSDKTKIIETSTIKPRFHRFIIALPNWMNDYLRD